MKGAPRCGDGSDHWQRALQALTLGGRGASSSWESSSRPTVHMAAAPRACGSHPLRPPGLVQARARTARRRHLRARQLHRLRGAAGIGERAAARSTPLAVILEAAGPDDTLAEGDVAGEQVVVQRPVCEDAGVQCVIPTAAQELASSLSLDLERLREDMAALLRRADAAEAVVAERDEMLARLRALAAEEAVQSQVRTTAANQEITVLKRLIEQLQADAKQRETGKAGHPSEAPRIGQLRRELAGLVIHRQGGRIEVTMAQQQLVRSVTAQAAAQLGTPIGGNSTVNVDAILAVMVDWGLKKNETETLRPLVVHATRTMHKDEAKYLVEQNCR